MQTVVKAMVQTQVWRVNFENIYCAAVNFWSKINELAASAAQQ
jgi:hypothetical protein